MAGSSRSVITPNSTKKFDLGFSSDESISSDSSSEEFDDFQKRLPMKKRQIGMGGDFDLTNSPQQYQNHWVEKQQKYIKKEGAEENYLLKPEPKKAKILP